MRSWLQIFSLVFLATLGACARTGSADIATNSIVALFSVSGNSSNSVTCSITLQAGEGLSPTTLYLTGGDSLSCSDGTKTLSPDENNFVDVHYSTSALSYSTSATYTIVFKRGTGESFTATAQLPAAVQITGPSGPQVKNHDLPVTWTAVLSGQNVMDLSLTYSQSANGGSSAYRASAPGLLNDNGSYTVPAADIPMTGTGTTNATLTLSRQVSGTHPSGLKGSTTASQSSSLALSFQ